MVLPIFIANTISLPDPRFRHPVTPAALLPVFACYYLHAILVLLPQTSALRFALFPVTVWQAWYVAVHYDLAKGIAGFLGASSHERIVCWNYAYVVSGLRLSLAVTCQVPILNCHLDLDCYVCDRTAGCRMDLRQRNA